MWWFVRVSLSMLKTLLFFSTDLSSSAAGAAVVSALYVSVAGRGVINRVSHLVETGGARGTIARNQLNTDILWKSFTLRKKYQRVHSVRIDISTFQ